jgi:hypothetical protein
LLFLIDGGKPLLLIQWIQEEKKYVERLKGILENTFEQFIIKLILSFILCTVLRSRELIVLPAFSFLFVIGRFTFALGYPTHRSFGMTMNFVSD